MMNLPIALMALTFGVASPEAGSFQVSPDDGDAAAPVPFRLTEKTLPFSLSVKYDLPHSGVTVHRLSFPSLVESPYLENNTVHAEYYQPHGEGPFPAVIILDVLAGDQSLARGMGVFFAQHKIAGLFVQMAYYGPRRPVRERVRLLTPDIPHTVEAIRQSVIDCRCATAWLASRSEVHPDRLGVIGTSLGSFIAGITGAVEPRLSKVALLLSGGGLVDAYYDHPKAGWFRTINEFLGGSKEKLKALIDPVDPITYANLLRNRDVLMIAALRDDIVPTRAARALWQAAGEPKILWVDTDHYGAVFYLLPMMRHVLEHFRAP